MTNQTFDISTKIKNIIQIIKNNLSHDGQAMSTLLAFSVWSEKMPCEENLTEILTYINLYYLSNEYIFDEQQTNTGIDQSLFTNNLYIQLLNNLKTATDINSKMAVMCIVTSMAIKKSSTKVPNKYLKLFDDDKIFKTIYAYFTKQ